MIIRKNAWLKVVPGPDSELKIIIHNDSVVGARNSISARNCIHMEHDVMFSPSRQNLWVDSGSGSVPSV
jgi:hypothetical protein